MGDKNHFAGKIPVLDTCLLMKEFSSPRPLLLGEVMEILLKILEEALSELQQIGWSLFSGKPAMSMALT